MKKSLQNFLLTVKMLWRMLHPILRGLIITIGIICLLILILSPDRGFWGLVCLGMLLLLCLSGYAIYLILNEIK